MGHRRDASVHCVWPQLRPLPGVDCLQHPRHPHPPAHLQLANSVNAALRLLLRARQRRRRLLGALERRLLGQQGSLLGAQGGGARCRAPAIGMGVGGLERVGWQRWGWLAG